MTEARGLEAGGLVAVDAIAVGRYVEVAFADSSISVMTGCAIVDDTLVVKTGAGKGGGVMAQRAIPACVLVDLVIRRPACRGAVMAGRTVIHDSDMVEYRRRKGTAGHVTNSAIFGRRNVRGIEVLALRRDAIVAGVAAYGQNSRVVMIDKCVAEISRVMTQGTIRRGYRVRRSRCLAPGPQSGKAAIVTGDAITGDSLVRQHRGWCESGYRMACIAILSSRQMAGRFYQQRIRGKELTGMTTFAAASDVHMLRGEERCRSKSCG